MAIEDLYVPGAARNPFNAKHAPKTQPTIEFPLITETPRQQRRLAYRSLGRQLLMAVGTLVTLIYPHDRPIPTFVIMLLILSAYTALMLIKQLLQSARANWHFLIYVPPVYLFGLITQRYAPNLLWGFTAVVVAFQAIKVATHYRLRAATGTYSETQLEQFRNNGTLPAHFPPGSMVYGAFEAVVSFLTYNHYSAAVPGALLKPQGSYGARTASTHAVVCLLAISLFAVADRGLSPFPFLATIHPILAVASIPVMAVGIWVLAAVIFACPVAGPARGMMAHAFSPANWPRFVKRMNLSPDTTERKSLLLGLVDFDRSPILYLIDTLFRHAWIVGKTGSGKTSFLLFILDQLVRRNDLSVIYLDLKALTFESLATMERAAKDVSTGNPAQIKHFTLEHGEATYLFDIFSQQWWLALPAPQRTGVVLSALNLAYSQAYGQSWYRDAAYDVLHFVLDRHPDVKSWDELRSRIEDAIRHARPWELSDSVKHDGIHVALIVKRLAALSALNARSSMPQAVTDNAIEFADAFNKPQHFYFDLGAIRNGLIAGEVGRLLTASVLNAAAAIKTRKTPVLIFIDEWQCMVTNQLSLLLEQARGLGIGVVLANQTTAQLITPDGDLRPIVEGNTSLQAWLQITDDVGREQLRRLGGQEIIHLTSKTVHSDTKGPSYTYSEQIHDRVTGNLISAVGSEHQRFFMRLTDNAGYACYGDLIFVARSFYHQTKDQYDADCAMPWPAPTPETMINSSRLPPDAPPMAAAVVPTPLPPGSGKKLGRRSPTNPQP